MRQLGQDLGAFIGEVLEDDVLGNRLAIEDAGWAVLPIIPLLPDGPEAGFIKLCSL